MNFFWALRRRYFLQSLFLHRQTCFHVKVSGFGSFVTKKQGDDFRGDSGFQ